MDASPSLFSVMAALHAGGYADEINSPSNHPLRIAMRNHLASLSLPVKEDLRLFLASHRRENATAELSQYISFALASKGPPDFAYRYELQELPPGVAALAGLEKLMVRFHREARIDELWKKAQPAFDEAIRKYHVPVTMAVREANGYLRNVTSGFAGRRFQIYLDLLAPPHQVHTRSFKDDFFVVVTNTAEPPIDDIRHAYLYYLLDPVAIRHAVLLDQKRGLIDYAQGAPALEEHYKQDFVLLAAKCLIKAIEIRMGRGDKQALVDQAVREGYVLTAHFYEQLAAYEKQEQSLRLYFPEMVKAIDLKREEQRLEKVEFLDKRPVRVAKVVPAETKVELTGAAKTLEEAEDHYRNRDFEKARAAFLKSLQETDQRPLQAKAYYGLARIAALQRNPELSEKLFQKTLELDAEPQTRSWALVYLGRLADLAGEREQAVTHYQAAVAVTGASPAAKKAAEEGLKESFQKEKKE